MRRFAAASTYFLIVFAFGMILGTVRETLLIPHLGSTTAALAIELPFMIGACVAGALYSIKRYREPQTVGHLLGVGAIALTMLLVAEEGMTRILRGTSILDWWSGFSAGALAINLIGLVAMFLMPLLVGAERQIVDAANKL